MSNGDPRLKITWEEGLIASIWHRLRKAFSILNKQRISQNDKCLLAKILRAGSRAIVILILILITIVTYLGITFFNSKENEVKVVTKELFIINPHIDPDVAPIISKTIVLVAEAFKIDKWLIVAITKYESGVKIFAKNPNTGAMGLMQWMVSNLKLEQLGIQEWEKMHIKTNVWNCSKILWDGYHPPEKKGRNDKRDGTTKQALFYYNGVVHNVMSGNEYVANVLGCYYDIRHRLSGGNSGDGMIQDRHHQRKGGNDGKEETRVSSIVDVTL